MVTERKMTSGSFFCFSAFPERKFCGKISLICNPVTNMHHRDYVWYIRYERHATDPTKSVVAEFESKTPFIIKSYFWIRPYASSSHLPSLQYIFLTFMSILSFILLLILKEGRFKKMSTKILSIFLGTPVYATCPNHLSS